MRCARILRVSANFAAEAEFPVCHCSVSSAVCLGDAAQNALLTEQWHTAAPIAIVPTHTLRFGSAVIRFLSGGQFRRLVRRVGSVVPACFLWPQSSGSTMAKPLDVMWCRRQFPALARRVADSPAVFFDGPAGSQVPQRVVDAVGRYLIETNANHGGALDRKGGV